MSQRRCRRCSSFHPPGEPCHRCGEDEADKERIYRESLRDKPPEVTGWARLIAGILR